MPGTKTVDASMSAHSRTEKILFIDFASDIGLFSGFGRDIRVCHVEVICLVEKCHGEHVLVKARDYEIENRVARKRNSECLGGYSELSQQNSIICFLIYITSSDVHSISFSYHISSVFTQIYVKSDNEMDSRFDIPITVIAS